ncbi:hypothetical protein B1H26_42415 [Amycolatopsis sp. BJA-103]|nr:hypothetical protein BKN51_00110 [Amycolatopsis sp. BJA-103]AUI64127.1 hypothetical protein BKN51_42255 [Amycolatopsis sp. BJA-103]PNE13090.1 hypothetical protein B1H26_42415 [Amycolatopsis sp. BJA-103]
MASYEEFLDDVEAGKVYIGGVGVGSDGWWVRTIGGSQELNDEYLKHLHTAYLAGRIVIRGPQLHLNRPRNSEKEEQ